MPGFSEVQGLLSPRTEKASSWCSSEPCSLGKHCREHLGPIQSLSVHLDTAIQVWTAEQSPCPLTVLKHGSLPLWDWLLLPQQACVDMLPATAPGPQQRGCASTTTAN